MTLSTATATATWSRGPAVGLAVQFVLLAAIAGTTGLSVAGWLAGTAYGIGLCALLAAGLRRAGMTSMGPANVVTFARALMIGGVTAMVVSSLHRPVHQTALVALVGVALALDGVDGQVARRTGSTTKLGARFDMEVDSVLVLLLSVIAAGTYGWWTIAIGGARYAFLAASWAVPWMTAPLPPRFSRKVVAAAEGVVLVVALAHILPEPVVLVALIAALTSVAWSFGLDVRWLWRAELFRRAAAARPNLPILPRPRAADFDRKPLHRRPAPVS